jgi:hypothetical protein
VSNAKQVLANKNMEQKRWETNTLKRHCHFVPEPLSLEELLEDPGSEEMLRRRAKELKRKMLSYTPMQCRDSKHRVVHPKSP